MIQAIVELGRRYRFDHLPERESYVMGTADGRADCDADGPHERQRRMDSFDDQLLYALLHCGRATRAHTVGYVRGYRDEAGVGGRAA